MSIWSHMNDVERQTLREARRAIREAETELAKIDKVKTNAELRLDFQDAAEKRYQEVVVARAMGEDIEGFKPDDTETADAHTLAIRTRALIEGLAQRRQEQERELEAFNRSYDFKVRAVLQSCLNRAADTYRQQAEQLIDSWKELNLAQTALGDRDLAWIHIFLPALPGMQGASASHSRLNLFDGKNFPLVDGSALKAELKALLD